MEFIVLVRRDVDRYGEAEFAPLLEPEAQRVRELYIEGVIRRVWSRKDVLGAVLLLEAESVDAVHATLETLPLRQRGMLGIDAVVPLAGYRGFAPRG
jgi:muconolactone delta-isomerase